MKITFLGAAKSVTGSCYLVETEKASFLVDCGMFQGHAGRNGANEAAFPFHMNDIGFMLLTHAHIDHSGRIPKLWLDGYRGPIYATKATADLCSIMLPDSGHIQEIEAEWSNRKAQRSGKPREKPLYTAQNALDSLKLFKPCRYDEAFSPAPGIRVVFRDAGHILGSSITEIWAEEGGRETKAVFSGDLGFKGKPILRDPAAIDSADWLVLETTYGDRLHTGVAERSDKLFRIIDETAARGGNIIIPSFAVGRTQEIVYEFNKRLEEEAGRSEAIARLPVYIDSPLAVSATQIFRQNMDCFDEEAQRFIASGDNPLDFPNLHFVKTMDESKALNEDRESKIIISASGMCDAGRIKHHLKHNLWRKESTILFVGYQAEGTLGRQLVDGAKYVKLFGEDIRVNARIETIEGFSGHADREGLLSFVAGFRQRPSRIMLVHGEDTAQTVFAAALKDRFGIDPSIPAFGESVTLGTPVAQSHAELPREGAERKLAVVSMLDALDAEFRSRMADMRAELMKTAADADIAAVADKVKRYADYLRVYEGK